MLLLTGEFDLTLDDKHRLALPVKVREELARNEMDGVFYLMLGTNRVIHLFPEKVYQQIALVVAPRKAAPDELLTQDRVNFSLANRVELDRQGRLLVGERTVRRAGLDQQVVMIGTRDHLELWEPQRWERYLGEHFGAHENALLSAREEVLAQQHDRSQAGS